MNSKVILVITIGLLAIGTLFFVPPWKAHGVYGGHFRVDRVAWLELDTKRFYLEEGAIALLTLGAAIMVRNRK